MYAFEPAALGTFTNVINVTDSSDGSSAVQTITLTGTGTPPAPVANLSPAALNFGNVLRREHKCPAALHANESGKHRAEFNKRSRGRDERLGLRDRIRRGNHPAPIAERNFVHPRKLYGDRSIRCARPASRLGSKISRAQFRRQCFPEVLRPLCLRAPSFRLPRSRFRRPRFLLSRRNRRARRALPFR